MSLLLIDPTTGRSVKGEELDLEWHDRAHCAGSPVEWWFPVAEADWPEAKARCRPCPVQTECLVFALVTRSNDGCWGGKDHKERRQWAMTPRGRAILKAWGDKLKPARDAIF